MEPKKKRQTRPSQRQKRQPGIEKKMHPRPKHQPQYVGSGKLLQKVAIITGGDSGIGRSVAIHFAREGANVAIIYYNEHQDAKETKRLVEEEGRSCLLIAGDIGKETFCKKAVEQVFHHYGKVDILVNNAAIQFEQKKIEDITEKQLERTFRTNIFSFFYMTKAVLKHFTQGSVIINTASVTAYRGSPHLIDYSSTKGAIISFTRSLSLALIKRKIRVNAVAPGPIWTPLIPATFKEKKVKEFGSDTPIGRPGEPSEVAPAYVFLASNDSSYFSGQVLHPNGGEIINT